MNDFSSQSFNSFPTQNAPRSRRSSFLSSFGGGNKKPVFLGAGVLLLALIGIASFTFTTSNNNASSAASVLPASDKRTSVEKPKAEQKINREFLFPLKNQLGKEVSKLKYEVQTAELRDEIVIKGAKATAVKGRTFLIISLKVTNNYDKSIQLNARDYLRLIVDNSPEKLAPDIHNDPVEVQAISTKYTRVGFPIDDKDQKLVLQVGEVAGKKDLIELKLQ